MQKHHLRMLEKLRQKQHLELIRIFNSDVYLGIVSVEHTVLIMIIEGFLISNESGKWKEAQETIYETKKVTKEEKYSNLGALSPTRQIQMKYLAI